MKLFDTNVLTGKDSDIITTNNFFTGVYKTANSPYIVSETTIYLIYSAIMDIISQTPFDFIGFDISLDGGTVYCPAKPILNSELGTLRGFIIYDTTNSKYQYIRIPRATEEGNGVKLRIWTIQDQSE